MPQGKPAGVRCVQLSEENLCRIFGKPERPDFCGSLKASADMCGGCDAEAMHILTLLEAATAPSICHP
jgi:uncharacterized protein